jgi:hypothetical protein
VTGTSQIDLGGGIIADIVGKDGFGKLKMGIFSNDSYPPSENDYSAGIVIRYGAFDEFIGGDLSGEYYKSGWGYTYHDIEHPAAKIVRDMNVYRVDHHGSSHSSNATFVGQLKPRVSIVSVGDSNTFGHPAQSVMDRILATGAVYMTERGETSTNIGTAVVGGDIVIKTDGTTYTFHWGTNSKSYTATDPIRTDADGDGYFAEVDPNDSDPNIIPAPNGGYDPVYQP